VKARGSLIHYLRGRGAGVPALIAIAGLLLVCEQLALSVTAEPQRQRPGRRRRSAPPSAKLGNKYSNFTHESHSKHAKDPQARTLKCNDCHVIRSATDPGRIAAATKHTAAAPSYPYHDSCLRCHEQQFYRGDRPVICTVCHSRVAVRLTSRDVYSKFPSPKRGDIMMREFPGYYPHGLHQSVMALDRRPPSQTFNAGLVFQRVSFRSAPTDRAPTTDICARCHFTDQRGPITLRLSPTQKDDTFKRIEADTFKTVPGYRDAEGHGYCFTCHWEAQRPNKDDCDGCHLSRSDYAARKVVIIEPPALSAKALTWFENWPSELPKRFSLKFRHNTHTLSPDGKTESNNHDFGCTTCHLNIASMTTLSIPKADVRIVACGPCHGTTSAIPVGAGIRVTLSDEMRLRTDISKNYTCVACHTSVIGREQAPCTHYSVIGQPCPKLGSPGE